MDGRIPYYRGRNSNLLLREAWVVLDRFQASYSWFAFDATEDLVNGEPQQCEVLFRSEGSERIQRENRECLLLEGGLPLRLLAWVEV